MTVHRGSDWGRWVMVCLCGVIIGFGIGDWRHPSAERADLAAARDTIQMLRDSLARAPRFAGPPDSIALRQAADAVGIPAPLLYAIAIVESGYAPPTEVRGRHGEVGRLQVRPSVWGGTTGCEDPATLQCGATILAWCRAQHAAWRDAVACYNASSDIQYGRRYLALVERQIGRLYLEGLQ